MAASRSQLLGWDDRVGTIEPGKFVDMTDMIVVEGDSLPDWMSARTCNG
jgi:imidazolonepropionase-like amidohydrolase